MRTFEISYKLRGQIKYELVKAVSSIYAIRSITDTFARRDFAFFSLVAVKLV